LPIVYSRLIAHDGLWQHDACRLQSSAKGRKRRNVLDEGTTGLVEADRRAGIDAFKRHGLLVDVKDLLITEYALDVASVQDASDEASPAAVHRNSNLEIGA
jgi:hypothetical protein